jgi:hypothetical protein
MTCDCCWSLIFDEKVASSTSSSANIQCDSCGFLTICDERVRKVLELSPVGPPNSFSFKLIQQSIESVRMRIMVDNTLKPKHNQVDYNNPSSSSRKRSFHDMETDARITSISTDDGSINSSSMKRLRRAATFGGETSAVMSNKAASLLSAGNKDLLSATTRTFGVGFSTDSVLGSAYKAPSLTAGAEKIYKIDTSTVCTLTDLLSKDVPLAVELPFHISGETYKLRDRCQIFSSVDLKMLKALYDEKSASNGPNNSVIDEVVCFICRVYHMFHLLYIPLPLTDSNMTYTYLISSCGSSLLSSLI